MVLNYWVYNEDWFQVMNVGPLSSLGENVHFGANSSIRNLGQLSLHIESEASEILYIYTAAGLQVLLNVLNE